VRLEALMGAVEDVREQMQESLAEVRQLVEQSREAVFRVENLLATSDPSASLRVAERVDGVHAIAERTRKRQGLLMGVVIAQAVMLVVAIVVVLLTRADVQEVAAGQPVMVDQDRTLTSAVDPHLQGENESPATDGIKRRRLSRRHR
jgi:hypothetical protein